jgi:hypothetical protein
VVHHPGSKNEQRHRDGEQTERSHEAQSLTSDPASESGQDRGGPDQRHARRLGYIVRAVFGGWLRTTLSTTGGVSSSSVLGVGQHPSFGGHGVMRQSQVGQEEAGAKTRAEDHGAEADQAPVHEFATCHAEGTITTAKSGTATITPTTA